MATTTHASDAPEVRDGRADASLRLTLRLELAEALRRIVPPLVTVYSDGEADLLPFEAHDPALDLLDELDAFGYVIVRRAAS